MSDFSLLLYYMTLYDLFIYFIVVVKIVYFTLVFLVRYFQYKQKHTKDASVSGFLTHLSSDNATNESSSNKHSRASSNNASNNASAANVSKRVEALIFWRDRMEFMFDASIALLLLFVFRPFQKKIVIDYETRVLFFLYGGLTLCRAQWSLFIPNSPFLHFIQSLN